MEAMDDSVVAQNPVISLGHENGGVGDLLNPHVVAGQAARAGKGEHQRFVLRAVRPDRRGLEDVGRGIAVDWSAPVSGDPGEQEFVLGAAKGHPDLPAGIGPQWVGREIPDEVGQLDVSQR